MNITTFNVNSVRARLDRLTRWLEARNPDVVCLQELKCVDADLPVGPLNALGYEIVSHGQKTYNGVAILSRRPMADVVRGLPDAEDPQARGIAATIDGVRILNLYVVNGQAVGTDKYAYKLDWLRKLHALVESWPRERLVVCGDFNIAPADQDVYDPIAWKDDILCSPPEREAFTGLLGLGLTDALRHVRPTGPCPTWWDYRGSMFEQQKGLRIDHHLVGAEILPRVITVSVDLDERAQPQASDHAPVTLHLRD
jgi:exodeoxyribonuclease III